MEEPVTASPLCNIGIFDSLSDDAIGEILQSQSSLFVTTDALLSGAGDLSVGPQLTIPVHSLCSYGLKSLVCDHFLHSLEESFERNGVMKFWKHFEPYVDISLLEADESPIDEVEVQQVLCKALDEISSEKQFQEKCLLLLAHALQSYEDQAMGDKRGTNSEKDFLISKYQWMVSSVLMASLPTHFPGILHWYFKKKLEEINMLMDGESNCGNDAQKKDQMDLDGKSEMSLKSGAMEIDGTHHQKISENNLVRNIGKVVRDLRSIGLTSMTESAYASAIFMLLKAKVHNLAGDDFRISILGSIKSWIQDVPLQFLRALLSYLGETVSYDSPSSGLKSPLASKPSSLYWVDVPSEGLVRWQLRLEYFAYETLQDLRIAKLFDIIVDYPDRKAKKKRRI